MEYCYLAVWCPYPLLLSSSLGIALHSLDWLARLIDFSKSDPRQKITIAKELQLENSNKGKCLPLPSTPLSPNRLVSKGPSGPSRKEIQMSSPLPIAPLSPIRMVSKGPSGPLPLTWDRKDPWLSLARSGDGGLVPGGLPPGPSSAPDVYERFYFCRQCWASKCRDS